MKKNDSAKSRLTAKLPALVLLFCLCQPVLDVLGYWQNALGIPNVLTLVVRMVLLLGTVVLGFCLTDRRWAYGVLFCTMGALLAGHVFACLQAGYGNPVEDLVEQLRIYLMPLTAVCFITFVRQNEEVFPAICRGIGLNLVVILLVEVAATVTGTDPHTYANKSLGVLGWFTWANSQSAILSMAAPIAISGALRRWPKRVLPVLAVSAVSLGMLYCIATRLAYAALAAIGLGLGLGLLVIQRQRWKQSLALLLVTAVFLGLYPVSPMVRNQKAVAGNAQIKQADMDRLLLEAGFDPEIPAREQVQTMETAYAKYCPGVVARFGIERAAEAYDYSTRISAVGDLRRQKLTFCRMLLEDSPASAKLFGMELGRMRADVWQYSFTNDSWTFEYQAYDVENDFNGVFYLCGWAGLGMMVVFLLYFALRAGFAMLLRFREVVTVEYLAFCIAFCCGVAHGYFTVSALRRNNASVYLGLVLVGLWYLTRRKTAADWPSEGGTP